MSQGSLGLRFLVAALNANHFTYTIMRLIPPFVRFLVAALNVVHKLSWLRVFNTK